MALGGGTGGSRGGAGGGGTGTGGRTIVKQQLVQPAMVKQLVQRGGQSVRQHAGTAVGRDVQDGRYFHPQPRVRLEAEGYHRDADEEHRYASDNLYKCVRDGNDMRQKLTCVG